MRCEDFPCCSHERGCCPDFDEAGNQLNMKCTCGATVPLHSSSSLCAGCLRMGSMEDMDYDRHQDYLDSFAEDIDYMDDPVENYDDDMPVTFDRPEYDIDHMYEDRLDEF